MPAHTDGLVICATTWAVTSCTTKTLVQEVTAHVAAVLCGSRGQMARQGALLETPAPHLRGWPLELVEKALPPQL